MVAALLSFEPLKRVIFIRAPPIPQKPHNLLVML